jgi:hypothetical protein
MDRLKTHGVTADTAPNILLGAGTFYKALKYEEGTGWDGTILGATSGGGKVSITPEYLDLDVDGAAVKTKGLTLKVGETATIEAKVAEFRRGIIVDALHLVEDTAGSKPDNYKKYVSKRSLSDDDYLENLGWVGTLIDGRQVIIILPNALITAAFEIETKNKEAATFTITAECTATFNQEDLEHLPYEIYFPDEPEVTDGETDEV